jgi:hypothetical protein
MNFLTFTSFGDKCILIQKCSHNKIVPKRQDRECRSCGQQKRSLVSMDGSYRLNDRLDEYALQESCPGRSRSFR